MPLARYTKANTLALSATSPPAASIPRTILPWVRAAWCLPGIANCASSLNPSAIGGVIAIANQVATTLAESALLSSLVRCPSATITSTHTHTWATTSRSRICKQPAHWHRWINSLTLSRHANATSLSSRID